MTDVAVRSVVPYNFLISNVNGNQNTINRPLMDKMLQGYPNTVI